MTFDDKNGIADECDDDDDDDDDDYYNRDCDDHVCAIVRQFCSVLMWL